MPNVPRHIALGPGVEFDHVRSMIAVWGDAAVGIGDDAAVLDVPPGERLVVSCDTSLEGVHFRREWISPHEIGYRSAQAALSDLAAMAAKPMGLLVGLTIPRDRASELTDLARGIGEAARTCGVPIRGGDLTHGGELSLSLTVLGSAPLPLARSAVRPLDTIYVTGALGGPLRAVRAWEAGERPTAWCRNRFARPKARIAEAAWLAGRGAHTMIDISDGLASELRHLASASDVQIVLDVDQVPCGEGGTWEDAVRGGEEYELVVALPEDVDVADFERRFAVPLTRVARAHAAGGEQSGVIAHLHGERVDLPTGHDHFST